MRVCLQMLLIIIPLHIVYFEIVRNILIFVGKLCIKVLILLKNVYIPSWEMSRSTFIYDSAEFMDPNVINKQQTF